VLTWNDTWQKVVTHDVANMITSDGSGYTPDDLYGEFLWLARVLISAGTWEIQARFGYNAMDDDDLVRGEIVEVTNTSFDLKELGISTIPLRDLQALPTGTVAASVDGTWVIEIWARRTAGAGTLDLDCVVPVPVDEGFLIYTGIGMDASVASDLEIGTSPHDRVKAYTIRSSFFIDIPEPSIRNFRLPPGDGRMAIAYARASSHVLADTIRVNTGNVGAFYPRWVSLRGAE
jgi:hypothetical protein